MKNTRMVPDDKEIRLAFYAQDAERAWQRLAILWPDVDIRQVKNKNPGARPHYIGSVLHIC